MVNVDFSEKVNSFQPDNITEPSLWKYCDEYLVMSTLIYFFYEKYSELRHADIPDLQLSNEIGIEVTNGLEDSRNKSIGEWTNCRMEKKGKTIEKCKKIIEKQGGKLFNFGIFFKTSDENSQMLYIKKRIDSKLKKLPSYRDNFNECYLAIVLEEPFQNIYQKAIDYFIEKQAKSECQFDKLIILSNSCLFIYDYHTKLKNKKNISKYEKEKLDLIGVMIVNGYEKDVLNCFVTSE